MTPFFALEHCKYCCSSIQSNLLHKQKNKICPRHRLAAAKLQADMKRKLSIQNFQKRKASKNKPDIYAIFAKELFKLGAKSLSLRFSGEEIAETHARLCNSTYCCAKKKTKKNEKQKTAGVHLPQ